MRKVIILMQVFILTFWATELYHYYFNDRDIKNAESAIGLLLVYLGIDIFNNIYYNKKGR